MPKIRFILGLICSSLLAACTGQPAPMQAYTPDYHRGQQMYRVFCAECHDSGRHDAPMLDQPDDWPPGALAFPSVLADHATHGYLNMPGKGGHGQLTDRNIQDAVHYMLRQVASEEE